MFAIISSSSDKQRSGRLSDSTSRSYTENSQKLYHPAKYLLFAMTSDARQSYPVK